MRLAVIPARGGSKRIPRKNIKPFLGRPVITFSIEAARTSGLFDKIVVSTDDAEIAEVARQNGAEVPFIRPADLSDDHATTSAVVAHAIGWLQDHGESFGDVCCIYATAPLISASDLREGLRLLEGNDCRFVLPVASYGFPIQRAVRLTREGRMAMFHPEHFGTRSQDLEEAYHDAGQFYWGRTQAWLDQEVLFTERTVPLVLPRHRVQDIDTPEDWFRAEILMKALLAHPEGMASG